ncbi:hypothetical protein L228DRAFT_214305 [Xylona heveae TC161]|uniref:Plasma membrane fusion protein PRM1 n=1 Tax=Xylona heveae (strain CBS 132557 / TC161) TaxID=1328760 RepID=A0A165A3V4_XYLHT|nr:hypothetical protein L228DRAFT_214305 [Xylona heveae TC161]KZF19912.1 hypothetical protein L228DRAFT_214305 [Xylona heveae TC161]
MRNYNHYAAQDLPLPKPAPHTAPTLTPYLGLRARLSQVWINRWTILLLLVLARSLLAVRDLNNDIGSARREALSACTGVESMGSAMASMPHYMSQGVNEMAASGVEKAVHGLMSMLLLTITGVEELVVFYINYLVGTYECLITLAARGAVDVALTVVEDAGNALNKTLHALTNDINKGIDTFEDAYNDLKKHLSGVFSIPTLNISSSLDELNGVQLSVPSSMENSLKQLNSSMPDFAQVKNFTDNAIRFPFEEVKKLIDGHLGNFTFDSSVLPIPAKEQMTFCSDNNGINDFFDNLRSIANLARKVFIGVIIVLAILACVPMAYREIRRWRTMQRRAQLLSQEAFDPMDVVQIASRPISSTIGIRIASKFSSTRRQILVRWFVAYCTTTPALFVLSLGLAGLFACLCQYSLLKSVEKEVPVLATEVSAFADKIVYALNNASEQWANGTNSAIISTNNDINLNVFGWVNTSTSAINGTLNTFMTEVNNVLNVTFGGTPLEAPIKGIVYCLLGMKVEGIQKGLTWVHNNAHVDFPLFPDNVFSLGASSSIANSSNNPSDSFLANTGSTASDQVTDAVVRMIQKIEEGVRTEAIISSCVLLVWVIIVLLGLLRTVILFFGRDKTRAEGGPVYAGASPAGPSAPIAMAPMAQTNLRGTNLPGSSDNSLESRHRPGSSTILRRELSDEKVGYAGQRNDVTYEDNARGHARVSSYGDVAIVDEKR